MKILMLNNEFPPIGGGGSTVTKYAVKFLKKKGHDVYLITSSFKNLPKEEIIDGATVRRVRAIRRYKDFCAVWELITYGLSSFFYCLFFIPKYKPDVIQAYFAVPAGGVAYLLHKIYKIPYVIYMGGSDVPGTNPSRYKKLYPFITPFIKLFWRPARKRVVAARGLLKAAQEIDPKHEFLMIPNGVDLQRFKPISRPPNAKVKILFIGRLIPRKGLQYVIEALPKIKELAKKEFEIEVVGTGDFRKNLDQLASKLKVGEYLKYVGLVDYVDLHKSYQYADVFVLTSLSEGMPCVMLEAMGCGLPIVATKVIGNEELVHEGENGFLVEVGDKDKLAASLAKLINDENLRKAMGKKSLEIIKNYDWRQIVDQYEKIYFKVLKT